jgi:hypothetical protein
MKPIKLLAWVFFSLAAASLVLPMLCIVIHWLAGPCPSPSIQLPVDPTLVGVDGCQRVLVYSSHYERLQVFDSDGGFVRGWFVKAGGRFSRFGASGSTVTFVYPTDVEIQWDMFGQAVQTTQKKGAYKENAIRSPGIVYCAEGIDCSKYRLRHRLLWASVTVLDSAGKERVLVRQPFPIAMIRIPSPAVFWALAGIVLLGVRRMIIRRRATADLSRVNRDRHLLPGNGEQVKQVGTVRE